MRDLGVGEPLLRHHLVEHVLDAAQRVLVEEGVEPQLDPFFLQLLGNLRAVDVLRPLVVHDLDALALLHVVQHDLADDAVGEPVIGDFDGEVVEEVGPPQPLEVVHRDPLMGVVPRHPDVLGRQAGAELDVIEVRFGLDDRGTALLCETGNDQVYDRPGIGRRQRRGLRDGRTTDGRWVVVRRGGVAGLRERRGRGDRGQKRRGGERSSQLLLHQGIPKHLSLLDLLRE